LYTYPQSRPSITVDIAIFRPSEGQFQILLIQRDNDPFQGMYALPGGFLDENESLETAALRELNEETGVAGVVLTQIHTFSDPARDPRGWVISTCFGAVLDHETTNPIRPGDDARSAGWFYLDNLPPLAFDHDLIIKTASTMLLSEN
jgi:8-oxo-dGTP diphosphatase